MSLTYSLKEAAELIGNVSADQLYQWIKQGKIPSRKLGRSWLLTRADVDDIIAMAYRPPTADQPQVVTEFALTRRSRRSA